MFLGMDTLLHAFGAMSFELQAAVDASVDAMLAAFEASVDASVALAEARVHCLCICVRSPAKAGNWYEIPLGPRTPEEILTPSTELVDLVQMATIASRHQSGELIWASWVPAARKSSIGHGSTLVMLNPDGASKIAGAMQMRMDDGKIDPLTKHRPMAPHHFDLVLRDWLRDGQAAEANPIQYCYVYPPIGNYKTHLSGCEPGLATGAGRENDWVKAWTCQGTRRSQDPQSRDKYLARLTKKGEPVWITKFDLDQESARHQFTWCSCWAGQGYPPMPRDDWIQAMGENDERVKFAQEGHRERAPGSEASQLPSNSAGTAALLGEPCEVVASSSDGAQRGAEVATASRGRTREARNKGHLVFQRTLRFWVYLDSGRADAILTEDLPAASVKELESRGLLASGSANINYHLAVNAPRARESRGDVDGPGRSSPPDWREGPPRRGALAEDRSEQEGDEAAASSSSRRPTAPLWSPRRRT